MSKISKQTQPSKKGGEENVGGSYILAWGIPLSIELAFTVLQNPYKRWDKLAIPLFSKPNSSQPKKMEDEFNDVMMEDEVAMEDEVTLPDLPPIERSSYGARRPSESSLDEAYGGNPSSDDPVFSSDDLPSASVDNYKPNAEGATKRKRMYRGPWWGEASDSKRKRADLETKEVDSGVWMNTDDDVAVDSSTAGDEVVNKGKEGSEEYLC